MDPQASSGYVQSLGGGVLKSADATACIRDCDFPPSIEVMRPEPTVRVGLANNHLTPDPSQQ